VAQARVQDLAKILDHGYIARTQDERLMQKKKDFKISSPSQDGVETVPGASNNVPSPSQAMFLPSLNMLWNLQAYQTLFPKIF